MTEQKTVTWRNLQLGQEIQGYKEGNRSSGFRAYVKDTNSAFVTVEMWRKGSGEEKRISSDAMFCVEMTYEEFKAKYFNKAKEVMKNIQTKLHYDEIGPHDMWNAWLSYDPYEMAQYCVQHNLTIVGHCTDIMPKISMFSGETLDVGVCVECEDGERFWCHWKMQDINELIADYPELLEAQHD